MDGTAQLPDATLLDGELIVWEAGRLAFERLQRGAGAARAADEWSARFGAFDLLRLSGTDMTGWPYRRRRHALESVFTPPADGAVGAQRRSSAHRRTAPHRVDIARQTSPSALALVLRTRRPIRR
ncbi:hypothetical protein OG410_01030 [Streptomyces sp. NBC_00659]|uniref:ATP-dependent DNA ligase n=1 Tax=Streptomyces sp. NBC_00659 TaxID=2903669 RepID=UPI002E3356B0|nr:hypothetical protein [Streptomyces sp. NBC_00659]